MKTAVDLKIPETFNAAAHFVDRNVEEGRGAKIAIECGDERVTYGELLERVNRFGDALRHHCQVRPEERVMLLLLDDPRFFYAFFGSIKIGAVPVPTNTLWKAADYRYVLRDARARVLVVSEQLLAEIQAIAPDEMPALEAVVVARAVVGTTDGPARHEHRGLVGQRCVDFDDLLEDGSPALEAEPTSRDGVALWLYSSGSTGAPKGCVHLQHDMVLCAELFAKGVLGVREDDRLFSGAKLFFAYGLGNAGYFPLSVGATSILFPGPPTPANVCRTIVEHRPSLFFWVPTGYAMLLAQAGDVELSSVRLAVSAGEALPAAIYERFRQRFGIDIIDGIGSTEALHMFISNRPGAIRPGSSGRFVAGYDAAILDDEKRPVAHGEMGNLWIAGDSVCAGYWNQHDKTRQTIEGAWIRTGDKYSEDSEGFYWYAGRSDDMLKVGGLWVSPVEVENALIEHEAVQECGVVGREDHDTLVKPVAFVVLKRAFVATPELAVELQQFVRTRLAEYKRPRWVTFVDQLPKTPTGKIQRFKLRELANTPSGSSV